MANNMATTTSMMNNNGNDHNSSYNNIHSAACLDDQSQSDFDTMLMLCQSGYQPTTAQENNFIGGYGNSTH